MKDDELRKQLERAGLYDILSSVHESHEDEDCFCTTEIAPFYRQLLRLIKQYGNSRSVKARDIAYKAGYEKGIEAGKAHVRMVEIPALMKEKHDEMVAYGVQERIDELETSYGLSIEDYNKRLTELTALKDSKPMPLDNSGHEDKENK